MINLADHSNTRFVSIEYDEFGDPWGRTSDDRLIDLYCNGDNGATLDTTETGYLPAIMEDGSRAIRKDGLPLFFGAF